MILDKPIPFRYLFRHIKWEALFIIIYAIGVTYLDEYIQMKDLSIPIGILSILGTTISLILAFRTGQAYDRWWEARKVWGAIVNDSRTLVRQALTFGGSAESVKITQSQLANNQIAWCYALGDALRKESPQERSVFNNISNKEDVVKHANIPNAILTEQANLISKLNSDKVIDTYQFVQMDSTLRRLTDSMGMAERINNTVFPKFYSTFVDWFLYLFIILLPFGILDYFHILEAPIIIGIAISFVVLEKLAILLQDPFRGTPSDVPITSIANTIETNIRQMMKDDTPPLSLEDRGYYTL